VQSGEGGINMRLYYWGVFTLKGTLKAVADSKWRARKFGETWNSKFLIIPVTLEPTGKDKFRFSRVILRDKDRVYSKPPTA
jgi:hypothetical protein